MDRLLIELPWPPSVNHYYRRVGHRTLISREGRKYRTEICAILRDLHFRPFDGELSMTVDAYPPDKRRRDLDNILKSLFDAMQHGGAYRDDSQIKKLNIEILEPCRPDGKVVVRLGRRKNENV
ncbi:MAG: RusA family crossover junction endodeoxyribonuclease [Pirellulales bacterium]|nr:RusA family crossover junction endodeoxyribonuclease [Pirellulales bacterium]